MKSTIRKDIIRRASVMSGALFAVTMTYAGCRAHDASDDDPTPAVRGVYALESGEGDIAILSFIDDARYWLWKNKSECSASGNASTCGEWGNYVLAGDRLTLTDDGSKTSRSFSFHRGAAQTVPAIKPSSMTVGVLGGGLVGGGSSLTETQKSIAGEVTVEGRSMRLTENPLDLLTCQALEAGSGAIPGAPSPDSNFRRGAFTSGEFGPGGQYDTRTVPTDTLYRTASATSHRYALISDRLPAGTTWQEANAALQRFNGPTAPAMRGEGDDPNATQGWVVVPVVNMPIGCVTFERGDGWARNTTQWNHPLIGTITRYVVDGGNCTYRILTVGEGQGGSVVDPSKPVGRDVTAVRHISNIMGGPTIFRELDRNLIGSVRPSNPGGGC